MCVTSAGTLHCTIVQYSTVQYSTIPYPRRGYGYYYIKKERTMTEPINARGYAFTAFAQTWASQLSYAAMAAAHRHGYYPSRQDYINQGLRLFDRMYTTEHRTDASVRVLINTIIKDMGQSIRTDVLGHFKYTTQEDGTQWISTKHDVILDQPLNADTDTTIADTLPDTEGGYTEMDDDEVMFNRLTLIADRLSDEDMGILEAYVDGDTFNEACRAKDVDSRAFTNRIRTACASLKKDKVFA